VQRASAAAQAQAVRRIVKIFDLTERIIGMPCDLDILFGQVSQTMPTSTDGNHTVLFSAQTLPVPELQLKSDRLIIKKYFHDYRPSFRVTAIWFQAHKLVYRQLGLLILSVVFEAAPNRIDLELTHPASDIKHLLIDYPYRGYDPEEGYVTRHYGFQYSPALTEKHPWIHTPPVDPDDLPVFRLTNQEESIITDDQVQGRDTVVGFGLEEGSVRLAELLLNMSLPHNSVNEYVLEREGGYRGVGTHSAEVRFFLPGSVGWEDLL
jgi:hypothetical protein